MRISAVLISLGVALSGTPLASQEQGGAKSGGQRFPEQEWQGYVDVGEAGYSAEGLERAQRYWERRGSPAFMAVADGAVIAAWGDVERRFMCHSMRKSFLSALYGVYSEQIDLDLTLMELEIDDEPALSREEKQARVGDLLASRSGVYHDAAAESGAMIRDRPARGSYPPNTHWYYNNWDFNAAGTIFRQLTRRDIFEAFDQDIAQQIGMQDYRPEHGFYHYEPDRSVHPAYMLRMSTRDLVRFGLLFSRDGRWRDQQVLPEVWVRESTRSRSDVDMGANYGSGYGYMWWVEGSERFTARGAGGHILAVYPSHDLVMAIRADTYHDRSVSARASIRLFEMVIDAKVDAAATSPRLERVPATAARNSPALPAEQLSRYANTIEMDSGRLVRISEAGGRLAIDYGQGQFLLHPLTDTRFVAEDLEDPVVLELSDDGQVETVWMEQLCYFEAAAAAEQGDTDAAVRWVTRAVEKFPESARAHLNLAKAYYGTDRPDQALTQIQRAREIDPHVERGLELLLRVQVSRYAWHAGIVALVLVGVVARKVRRSKPRT